MMLKIKVNTNKKSIILEVIGRVDHSTVSILDNELTAAMKIKCSCVILDCKKMDYLNVLGLRFLLNMSEKFDAQNCKLCMVNTNHDIEELFNITGTNNKIYLYKTLEEAIL